ncbi:DUF6999 family protein [Neosynechococcus sphagnicola]|uniref:DUF6999 family protein n=1 Tax=Neosynechococcus sphagnicola TaxID=1501145 RepID=UPI00068B1EEE|nr:hypothetical protein [Neosynechococcus sphagnicola]
MTLLASYFPAPRDRRDPNAWDALYLDQAIPVDPVAKAYMVQDLQSWSRRYLLVPIRLVANLSLAMILTLKRLLPFQFHAYQLMHRTAAWFLQTWVSPAACYLIVRHLGIGSNIVNFLIDNGPDSTLEKSQLYPRTVADLAENAFLEHDLILYNFLLDYQAAQQANPDWVGKLQHRGLSYDSIQPLEVQVAENHTSPLRVLDLESAIELFKVFYSLWLTCDEFERAVLSLQLDETIACHVSVVTGDHHWNHLVTNRHPLAPNSPFHAARDLILHGILSEYLHRYLEIRKQQHLQDRDLL